MATQRQLIITQIIGEKFNSNQGIRGPDERKGREVITLFLAALDAGACEEVVEDFMNAVYQSAAKVKGWKGDTNE